MAIVVTNASGFNHVNAAWGFSSTAGRVLIGGLSIRNWYQNYTPKSGWATLAERNGNVPGTACVFQPGRVAVAGENTIGGSGFSGATVGAVVEVSGATIADALSGGFSSGNSGTMTSPSITPTRPCILVSIMATTFASAWSAAAGWTKVSCECPPSGESDWPRVQLLYRLLTAPVGSYQAVANMTIGGGGEWASTIVAVYSDQTTPLHNNVVII